MCYGSFGLDLRTWLENEYLLPKTYSFQREEKRGTKYPLKKVRGGTTQITWVEPGKVIRFVEFSCKTLTTWSLYSPLKPSGGGKHFSGGSLEHKLLSLRSSLPPTLRVPFLHSSPTNMHFRGWMNECIIDRLSKWVTGGYPSPSLAFFPPCSVVSWLKAHALKVHTSPGPTSAIHPTSVFSGTFPESVLFLVCSM